MRLHIDKGENSQDSLIGGEGRRPEYARSH